MNLQHSICRDNSRGLEGAKGPGGSGGFCAFREFPANKSEQFQDILVFAGGPLTSKLEG
jgi:hypothetical protein